MITKSYKSKLSSVLRLYEDFKKTLSKVRESESKDVTSRFENLQKNLSIAVTGDSPCGNSDFINACIGREVLPDDASLSAVINVRYGDDYSFEAKTAGGILTNDKGENKVREFLQQVAAVPSRYRNIPAVYINELLIKKKGALTDEDIAKAENNLRDTENINQDGSELQSTVESYIKEFRPLWEYIVTEITVSIPLPENLRDITLTDCPYVPAEYDAWNKLRKNLDDADVIVFLKPLDSSSLESERLNALLSCQDNVKVLLVFTGWAELSAENFECLRNKALEAWGKAIPDERIIFADCKAQILLDRMEQFTAEKISDYFDQLRQSGGDNFQFAVKLWINSKRSTEPFLERMSEFSNFKAIKVAIGKLIKKTRYMKLLGLLDSMIKDCDKLTSHLDHILRSISESKAQDFKKFVYEKRKTMELDELSIEKGDLITDLRYTNNKWSAGGIILKQLKTYIKEPYTDQNIGRHRYQKLKSLHFNMISLPESSLPEVCTISYCPGDNEPYHCKGYMTEWDDETLPDFSPFVSGKINRKTSSSSEEFALYSSDGASGNEYADAQLVFEENCLNNTGIKGLIDIIDDFIKKCVDHYDRLISNEKESELSSIIYDKKYILEVSSMYNEYTDKVSNLKVAIEKLKNFIKNYII